MPERAKTRDQYVVERKGDTFIIRESSARERSMTKSVTLPTGGRVHVLDRGVFKKALSAVIAGKMLHTDD